MQIISKKDKEVVMFTRQKTFRKTFVVFVLSVFCLTAVFLCAEKKEVKAAEKVTVKYWALWNEGEPQHRVLTELIGDAEAAFPNMKVEATWVGRQVLLKLKSALAVGEPPDIVDETVDNMWVALIRDGLAYSMSEALAEYAYDEKTKWADTFVPGILGPYRKNGENYFIPYQWYFLSILYDGRVFREHGITVPKTWDELVAVCEKLRNIGIAPFSQDGGLSIYNQYWYDMVIYRILGEGAFHEAVADKTGAAWDNPGFLEAARKVQQMSKNYFIKDFDAYVWPAGQVDFALGEAAMLLGGTWMVAELLNSAPEGFEFQAFPFPEIAGGKGKRTELHAWQLGFTVLKDARHPKEAIELIRFLLRKESMEKYAREANALPTIKGIPAPPNTEDWLKMAENATKMEQTYQGVNSDFPEYFNMVLLPLDDQLISGKITPEEFIAEIKKETVGFWKK